jgi:hypothetical protein
MSRDACRRWRSRHPGHASDYMKSWRAKHPNADAKYYADNREKELARRKANRAIHSDREKNRSREYAASHLKQRRRYLKKYREQNPNKIRAWRHNRRARVVRAGGRILPSDIRMLHDILGSSCMHPDKSECRGPISDDHVIPLAQGGTNHPTNIQFLCHRHNVRKNKFSRADYRTPAQLRRIMAAFQLSLFAEAA